MGAGLPVISTLSSLMNTGDEMIHIEGILSGTLSFIFNGFGAGKTFSQVVADAKAKGFTEPDPREDLAGACSATQAVLLSFKVSRFVVRACPVLLLAVILPLGFGVQAQMPKPCLLEPAAERRSQALQYIGGSCVLPVLWHSHLNIHVPASEFQVSKLPNRLSFSLTQQHVPFVVVPVHLEKAGKVPPCNHCACARGNDATDSVKVALVGVQALM